MKKAEINTPTLSTCNGKDSQISKQRSAETRIFFEYLQDRVASCTMVCAETGLPQKNATRYKRALEESNLLWELYEKRCSITGRKVAWITTNPELAPNICSKQLSFLFEGGEP